MVIRLKRAIKFVAVLVDLGKIIRNCFVIPQELPDGPLHVSRRIVLQKLEQNILYSLKQKFMRISSCEQVRILIIVLMNLWFIL